MGTKRKCFMMKKVCILRIMLFGFYPMQKTAKNIFFIFVYIDIWQLSTFFKCHFFRMKLQLDVEDMCNKKN
jgi:hypothetical protein